MLETELIQKINELRGNGLSGSDIAEELNLNIKTVYKYAKSLEELEAKKSKCFALVHGECSILTVEKCHKSKCNFYKTMEQARISREKAIKKIGKLSESKRDYISEVYFGGEKPWKRR